MKDEPVDILDEKGQPTGQVLMKSEVHAKSLWHPVTHLWIYNSKNQLLFQKRAPQKLVWPGKWDVSIGGHMAAGETPEQAVIKEAGEELSLKLQAGQAEFLKTIRLEEPMDGWVNRIFIHVFLLLADLDTKTLKLEEEEVSEARWFSVPEIEKC